MSNSKRRNELQVQRAKWVGAAGVCPIYAAGEIATGGVPDADSVAQAMIDKVGPGVVLMDFEDIGESDGPD